MPTICPHPPEFIRVQQYAVYHVGSCHDDITLGPLCYFHGVIVYQGTRMLANYAASQTHAPMLRVNAPPTLPTISLASTTRRANSPTPPSARRSRGAVPSTPHTRYDSCQQTPEPSPKPPDPSLKALVLPPRPLLWAQETQRTGLMTHPRMTPSPNNPSGGIRDTSMSPRTSGTSYASRRRPPMMANAPLHQTSSRIGSYLLMSSIETD